MPLVVFYVLFVTFFLVKVPYPLNLIDNYSKSVLSVLFGAFLLESDMAKITNFVFTFLQGIIAAAWVVYEASSPLGCLIGKVYANLLQHWWKNS